MLPHSCLGFPLVLRLDENADERLRAGGANEHPAPARKLGVEPLHLGEDRGGQPRWATGTFRFACGEAAASPLLPRPASGPSAPAEKERRRQPVARHVPVQRDHVTRLLAAEHRPRRAQRLEHVPVADVGREHADRRARAMRRWNPRFVIVVTATVSTPRSSASTPRIWSPSTQRAASSTASIRSPSPSNAIAEVVATGLDDLLQHSRVGRAAAHVDVRPVGSRRRSPSPLRRAVRRRRARSPSRHRSRSRQRSEGRGGRRRSAPTRGRRSRRRRHRPSRPSLRRRPERRAAPRPPPRPRRRACGPSASKNLTPLYSGGLCEAEITTPRSWARSATAGVGSTPPSTAIPPADVIPATTASSSAGPEPRVSRPTKTRPRLPTASPRGRAARPGRV